MQALQAQGFITNERTTYRIDTIPPRESLPASFSENKRRQIRKAAGWELADLSAEDFYNFHRHCIEAQGKRIDYPEAWAQAVLPEAIRQAQGRLIAAQNKDGHRAAAMFLAWDKERAYYLLPSYDPAYKDTGAMSWLTYEALCLAHERGLGFDFEGSMTPSIALSCLQFGGQAVVYHRIEKFYNPLVRIAVTLKNRL
jgi:lipid II:glycine glycyltransferase (peptidoglycan interpeptide bridge formation enzyme)